MRLSYHVKKFNQNIGEKENNCISKWKKNSMFLDKAFESLSVISLYTLVSLYIFRYLRSPHSLVLANL